MKKILVICFLIIGFLSNAQDKKISQLPNLPSVSGNEYIPITIGGTNYYVTPNQLKAWFNFIGEYIPTTGTLSNHNITGTLGVKGDSITSGILINDVSSSGFNMQSHYPGYTSNFASGLVHVDFATVNLSANDSTSGNVSNIVVQPGIIEMTSKGNNFQFDNISQRTYGSTGFTGVGYGDVATENLVTTANNGLMFRDKKQNDSLYLPLHNAITINGVTKKLLANPTFSISSTTSVSATSPLSVTSGTAISISNIPNSTLANSTISGISLGSNLSYHTNGYGLTGSLYNGSTPITWNADSTVVASKLYTTAKLSGKQNTLSGSTSQLLTAGGTTVAIGSGLTLTSNTLTASGGGGGISGTTNINQMLFGAGTSSVTTSPSFSVSTGTNNVTFGVGGPLNANITTGDPSHIFEVITSDASSQFSIRYSMYGSLGGQNDVHWNRYRGTVASPLSIQNGDLFMSNGFRAPYGTGSNGTFAAVSQSAGASQALATEDWIDVNHNGMAFSWQTTTNGTGALSRHQSMFLNGAGQLLLGPNSPAGGGVHAFEVARNSNDNAASLYLRNNGATAYTGYQLFNNAGTELAVFHYGNGWAASGALQPDGTLVQATGTGGYGIAAQDATGGNFWIYTGGLSASNRRLNISPAGVVTFTNSTVSIPTLTVTGNSTFTGSLTAGTIIKSGGTSTQILMADGSITNTSAYAASTTIITTIQASKSGTGSATTISYAHGLGSTPSFFNAIATNAAASNISYVTADATNINIVYLVAPASGTNNLSYIVEFRP